MAKILTNNLILIAKDGIVIERDFSFSRLSKAVASRYAFFGK